MENSLTMSQPLTSRERIQCMFEHRDADRAPIVDLPWDFTSSAPINPIPAA